MHTQCPQCATLHEINARELAQCKAQARCGRCGAVFDTLERLGDGPAGDEPPPPVFPSESPPVLGASIDELTATLPAPESQDPDFLHTLGVPEPPPQPVVVMARPRRTWPWVLATIGLIGALGAQFVHYERDRILNDPNWRGYLESGCDKLPFDCALPLPVLTDRIELVSRDIRPHPSVEQALIINATLRNAATFAQAYPAVEINLSDLTGATVASRVFEPAEYLDDNTIVENGIPAGALLPMVFEIVDPGPTAVAFEFEFRDASRR